ncbi:BTB/POZ domain-containing protein 6-like isoform X2 [Mizuhopecten yessoensis]|uniref:BTB/POZ domain-containing protein 6-like isoform X2 n=1 Tax=Mizuhopecten yessoensis TaxID=6573 RepID=UPI000B45AB02|nr:BTB/POZ domain-containing protein 6-like isoform X2 [Mizuhopecten yessoensis]
MDVKSYARMANETPWQSGKTLSECITHMLRTEVATDVTFVVEDSKVKAHKFILISRSPTFEAMFCGPMSEQENQMSGQKDIPMTDVSKETFNAFLRYMYTDTIDINIDNVADILRVADKYLVDILKQKCYDFIEEHLAPDNVCYMRERCHSFPNDKLLADCQRVEEESASDVLKSAGFAYLCKGCVHELIASDYLAVDEEVVYEAVTRWAEAECGRQKVAVTDENRRMCLGDLIYHVRFPVMNAEYFCSHVFQQSVLSNDELVEIHRYIHSQGQLNPSQVTVVHQDGGVSGSHSHITHKECCCSIQSNHDKSSKKCDHMDEINQSNLKQGIDAEEHHQSGRICGFGCNYRVGYRKGRYTLATRQKSTNCVIGTKIIVVSEHFQTTSRVYLHGITTPFRADQIIVSVNGEVVRSEVAGDNPTKVLFRKVIPINPCENNVIKVDVNNEVNVIMPTFTKVLKFDNVNINFSDDCNGYVSGLLLSK